MSDVSQRIKSAMKIRNMKQVDIVNKTGISKGALSSYLSSSYQPKEDTIKLIAKALDVSPLWLKGLNVPMDIPTPGHMKQESYDMQESKSYVFYSELPLNYPDYLFVGSVTQCAALISSYYVYVETSINEMHVLPLFSFTETPADFYKYPQELVQAGEHTYLTLDFPTIELELATATIIYYGIDTVKCTPEITTLSYKSKGNCFEIQDVKNEYTSYFYLSFYRELEKEAYYLKQMPAEIKEDNNAIY